MATVVNINSNIRIYCIALEDVSISFTNCTFFKVLKKGSRISLNCQRPSCFSTKRVSYIDNSVDHFEFGNCALV